MRQCASKVAIRCNVGLHLKQREWLFDIGEYHRFTPSQYNVNLSGSCRNILQQKSNIQNPCFALFRLYLKYVYFVYLAAHILTHFTRENVPLVWLKIPCT